jgi:hypothetical protein
VARRAWGDLNYLQDVSTAAGRPARPREHHLQRRAAEVGRIVQNLRWDLCRRCEAGTARHRDEALAAGAARLGDRCFGCKVEFFRSVPGLRLFLGWTDLDARARTAVAAATPDLGRVTVNGDFLEVVVTGEVTCEHFVDPATKPRTHDDILLSRDRKRHHQLAPPVGAQLPICSGDIAERSGV